MFQNFDCYWEKHPTVSSRGQELDGDDALNYARELKEAMDGFGTNEPKIIEVLVKHNNRQRQQIREAYIPYGDLIEDLKGELGGHFKNCIVGLVMDTVEYDASILHDATSGFGTNESAIAAIVCTRSDEELEQIKAKYEEMYDSNLVDDMKGDLSGSFRNLITALLEGSRQNMDGDWDDEDRANEQAVILQEAGVEQLGTDEAEFNAIFCNSPPGRLVKIMQKYNENTGTYLIEAIENEFSGDIKEGLLAILKCAVNESEYFADRLFKAMDGCGTAEKEVIRVLITRAEIDLEDIKEKFAEIAGKSLEEMLRDEFSGDLLTCLVSIVNAGYTK